ncbi:MAG: tripartite tricarboxylate transporter substrate binding protein, partial [Betaproteobacteria bacterium]|nr:tripartite tricarboxylate transporter substrate binding protein [Betaproteobacteria bacterium]
LGRIAAFVLAFAAAGGAIAQDAYPTRPVRLIVGLAPGGLADQIARLLSPGLSKELGQQILVENRTGATGTIAARMVADSPPDGYILMLGLDGTLIIPTALNPKTPFDPLKDFTPITKVAQTPLILVAHPSVPVNSLVELINRSRQGDTQFHYGTAGAGSSTHLAGEYLKMLSGLKMTHVPYKGAGEATRDNVGGQIPLTFSAVPSALPFVKAGKLKGLAVTSDKRFAGLPNVPTAAESGLPSLKGFNLQAWGGIFGPPGMPGPIVRRVHDAATKVLADRDLIEKYANIALTVSVTTPAQLSKQMATELEQWRRVIREAGIKPE